MKLNRKIQIVKNIINIMKKKIKIIKENEEVSIKTKKKLLAKELFGKFPRWKSKKSAQELKDEMRKGW